MDDFSRRTFMCASASALVVLRNPAAALAAPVQCSSPLLPSAVVPSTLVVDCAARQNFKLFRQNSDYVGLTGLISLTFVRGKWGSYTAGSLLLFPWLKPKGLALGASRSWTCALSTGGNQMMQSSAISAPNFAPDDYFCRYVLVASPTTSFIAVGVDVPYDAPTARLPWYSNVNRLADGAGVGMDWGSNFNKPWFAGHRAIPADDTCRGSTWRKVITEAVSRASVGSC